MFGSAYTFAKMVLGCIQQCRSQPRDSTDLACETVRYGRGHYVVFGAVGHGEDLEKYLEIREVTLSLVFKKKESGTC
jgi:hypothetical protein